MCYTRKLLSIGFTETAAWSHSKLFCPCGDSCKQQKYNTQPLQKYTLSDVFTMPLFDIDTAMVPPFYQIFNLFIVLTAIFQGV